MLLFIKKDHKGYTLTEALIVLLLLGVLCSFSLPHFTFLLAQSRAQKDQAQIEQAISFARTQALLLKSDVMLCPRDPHLQCGKDWQSGGSVWHCPLGLSSTCKLLHAFSLIEPQASLTGTRLLLHFSAQGSAYGSNLRLHYHSPAAHITQDFIVNKEGRLRKELS